MNIFWIFIIVAAVLIIFLGIFGFSGAGSIDWTIFRLGREDSNYSENGFFKAKLPVKYFLKSIYLLL